MLDQGLIVYRDLEKLVEFYAKYGGLNSDGKLSGSDPKRAKSFFKCSGSRY